MRDWLRRELVALLDWLLPPVCPLCGAANPSAAGFCAVCREDIPPLSRSCCPLCALPYPTEEGSIHLCETCLRSTPPFLATIAVGTYDRSLRQAIHRFKFDGALHLERPLARLLADVASKRLADWQPSLLVPVPLHRDRLRERGFNQTLLLGRALGRHLHCPVASRALVRTRATPPQSGLSAEERRHNLRGAFALQQSLPGERVLLLDDVMTTGTTARECARVLRDGGAEVVVAVLARAPRHAL